MPHSTPVARGCGTRVKGGIYAEIGLSEDGLPLEHFLIDPPQLLDPRLGVNPRGVTLIGRAPEIGGPLVFHVGDWIGAEHYPSVWDFLGEAKNFGISRRLPETLPFEQLTEESRLLLIHPRAAILNSLVYCGTNRARFGSWPSAGPHGGAADFVVPEKRPFGANWRPGANLYGGWRCPKCLALHDPHLDPQPCCAGIWAQDVTGGEPLDERQREEFSFPLSSVEGGEPGRVIVAVDGSAYPADDPRLVLRTMPSFRYVARRAPEDVEPVYHPAFFASFRVQGLVVVRGGEDDGNAMAKASAARGLPVEFVEE